MEKHVYSILAIKNNTRKNAKTPPKPTIKMNTIQKMIERQDSGCPALRTGGGGGGGGGGVG